MPSGKRVQVDRSDAAVYFRKAEQLCEAAGQALVEKRHDATVVLAIHAGINASDAVSIALVGLRSTDPDHGRAAELLRQVGGSKGAFDEHAQRLARLLSLKDRIEYENKRATQADAAQCAKRCGELVSWARSELTKARSIP